MCVVCHRRQEKEKLLRVTVKGGELLWDREMKLGGRGAYLCPSRDCIEKLRNSRVMRKLFRFLRHELPAEEVKRLVEEMLGQEG